ncbi:MAG: aminotransferase class IV [Candidatus Latescibacteria bacterium]|jgi:branched-chain amino acid aminotransferase|nr:aminotransferase class IV [Candidatus Latescibacterota bacterium]
MEDDRVVWLDGELIPWVQATVPLLSHGFSRGSAMFEAFGIHVGPNGPAAFRMADHLARLARSAELLEMELGYSSDEIGAAVGETVRANGMGRGVVKIMAYWGQETVTELVLDAKLDVAVFAIPENPDLHLDDTTPVSACLSRWRKLHPETARPEAKACANYLNAYLTRKDAIDRGYDVGIMLGTDDLLAEGSIESIFVIKDGMLRTPPLGRILSSVSRRSVLEIARVEGIPAEETALGADALHTADEIFTSHTGVKVHPVDRFEERTLDAPGPVTRRLIGLVEDILAFRDERFAHWFEGLG